MTNRQEIPGTSWRDYDDDYADEYDDDDEYDNDFQTDACSRNYDYQELRV